MGKDAFTPKAIANRMKAKGLQKLKFYCQMCQKQCRDENGFKCHCLSEGHQRQMAIFADNPDRFLDVFSETFEQGYLELLQRRFNTRRIHANHVYNEYIQDKEHVHMNSTIWPTLTDFVKYLGRTGKCVIDESDKGWHVTWIDRDPEALRRQAAAAARSEEALDDTARHEAELEARAAAARAAALAELFNDDDDDGDSGGGGGGGEDDAAARGNGGGGGVAAAAAAAAAFAAPAYTALLRDAAAGAVRIQLGGGGGGAAAASSAAGAGPSGGGAAAAATTGGGEARSSSVGAGAGVGAAGVLLAGGAASKKRRRFDVAEEDDDVEGERGGGGARWAGSGGGGGGGSAHPPPPPLLPTSSAAAGGAAARLMAEDLRLRAKAAPGAAGGQPSRFLAHQHHLPAAGAAGWPPAVPAAGATATSPPVAAASRGAADGGGDPARPGAGAGAGAGGAVAMPAPGDCWLVPGLVVKVLNAKVGGGAFYKRKALVTAIAPDGGGYVGVLRVLPLPPATAGGGGEGGGAVLKVDQAQLETVLPAVGGTVLVLAGPARGRLARLARIDEAAFTAAVQLHPSAAAAGGERELLLEYEQLCKWDPGAC